MATKVQGLDTRKAKMRRFPVEVQDEIRRAMEKSADEIVGMMKRLAPVESGTLRASIGWTWGDAPTGSFTLGEVREGKRAGNLRITIYAGSEAAYYARWQEFGTRKMAANPFFFTSYRALRDRVRGRTRRAVNKAAKKVAAGG